MTMQPTFVADICTGLQEAQKMNAWYMKSRIKNHNRILATVAGSLGFRTSMPKKEREKCFKDADRIVKHIMATEDASYGYSAMVITMGHAIAAFKNQEVLMTDQMETLARKLPVAAWVNAPEQKGFGIKMFAITIGETGDLTDLGEAISNHPDPRQRRGYANPGRVWKRLGCTPWDYNGEQHMGSTWRMGKEGKLTKEEWVAFGYSPRRRSIAWLIGDALQKGNGGGKNGDGLDGAERARTFPSVHPYRAHYDQTKALAHANHPDWKAQRCHLHGMLMATKLLLKNLWVEWNGHPPEKPWGRR